MFEITEIHFMPIKPRDGLIGFASIVIENSLFLGGIGIYISKDRNRYRLVYPDKKTDVMRYKYFHPINKETSSYFEEKILSEVSRTVNLLGDNVNAN